MAHRRQGQARVSLGAFYLWCIAFLLAFWLGLALVGKVLIG